MSANVSLPLLVYVDPDVVDLTYELVKPLLCPLERGLLVTADMLLADIILEAGPAHRALLLLMEPLLDALRVEQMPRAQTNLLFSLLTVESFDLLLI